jgi:putative nucleotidyltransferase with HDIG domain
LDEREDDRQNHSEQEMELLQKQLVNYAKDVSALYADLKKENEALAKANRELEDSFYAMVLLGFDLITLYDEQLGGHCKRVAFYSNALAEELGLDEKEVALVKLAALMHDIGLLGLPRDARKRIMLGQEQSQEMLETYRQHPIVSLRPLATSPRFRDLAEIIAAHHENLDGSGFPRGLHGDQIPLESRIIAIADAYDIVRQSTRQDIEPGVLSGKLMRFAGVKFDEKLLNTFKDVVVRSDPFSAITEVGLDDLKPGIILASALTAKNGVKLLSADTVLRDDHIDNVRKFARHTPLNLPVRIYMPRL